MWENLTIVIVNTIFVPAVTISFYGCSSSWTGPSCCRGKRSNTTTRQCSLGEGSFRIEQKTIIVGILGIVGRRSVSLRTELSWPSWPRIGRGGRHSRGFLVVFRHATKKMPIQRVPSTRYWLSIPWYSSSTRYGLSTPRQSSILRNHSVPENHWLQFVCCADANRTASSGHCLLKRSPRASQDTRPSSSFSSSWEPL